MHYHNILPHHELYLSLLCYTHHTVGLMHVSLTIICTSVTVCVCVLLELWLSVLSELHEQRHKLNLPFIPFSGNQPTHHTHTHTHTSHKHHYNIILL